MADAAVPQQVAGGVAGAAGAVDATLLGKRKGKPSAKVLEGAQVKKGAARKVAAAAARATASYEDEIEEEAAEAPPEAPPAQQPKAAKPKAPKAKPDTREQLCPFRSAVQSAIPIDKDAPVKTTNALTLMPTKGAPVTLQPGDSVTRWTVVKAQRKTEWLLFRIQKAATATNWTLIGRESDTDGQLVRFAAADVIKVMVAITPEDTLNERTTTLAELDRTTTNKIDDAKEEQQARKKAKKAKKAKENTQLRAAPVPIRNMDLQNVALVREAVRAEIAPLVTDLRQALLNVGAAEQALRLSQAVFVERLETVKQIGQSVAELAASRR
jgi:hypothetical protein